MFQTFPFILFNNTFSLCLPFCSFIQHAFFPEFEICSNIVQTFNRHIAAPQFSAAFWTLEQCCVYIWVVTLFSSITRLKLHHISNNFQWLITTYIKTPISYFIKIEQKKIYMICLMNHVIVYEFWNCKEHFVI